MRTLNLEEIIEHIWGSIDVDDLQLEVTLNPSLDLIKSAMKEACRRILELASENAEIQCIYHQGYCLGSEDYIVNTESIINTIKQIE